jgi:hypothetical protein
MTGRTSAGTSAEKLERQIEGQPTRTCHVGLRLPPRGRAT